MTQNNSIAKLAEQMRMTPQKLLEQLNAAGMRFDSADQTITSAEKAKLLSHLRALHAFYGEEMGVRIARKHFGWYAKARADDPVARATFNAAASARQQLDLCDAYFDADSGRPPVHAD
mgnify:CR=1 FL=1